MGVIQNSIGVIENSISVIPKHPSVSSRAEGEGSSLCSVHGEDFSLRSK